MYVVLQLPKPPAPAPASPPPLALFSATLGCRCVAPGSCGPHGSCNAEGDCVCSGGFLGPRCDDPSCVGIDCGAHGTLTNTTEACGCRCSNGYFGERCQFDPLPSLPPGAAEGFTIAGATNSWLDGRYERRSGECNGKPLYQLGDEEDGPLLFRPTGASYWNVADSSNGTCDDIGWISSRGSAAVGSGVCPLRPDAIGCAGRWLEYLDSAWQGAPSITVSP